MDFDDIVKIVDQVKVFEARLAAVEAERDAARAGEARAVEALRAVVAAASPHEEDTWTMDGSALRHVHRVLDQYEPTLDNQPSVLDWLAQQRREAAAKENDRWANEWWELARPTSLIASDFTKRAAALRAGEVGNE